MTIPEARLKQLSDLLVKASVEGSSGVRVYPNLLIGEGGQGWVFRAGYDEPDGPWVVVKMLRPDVITDESIARFLREAEVLRKLGQAQAPSPNVVRYFDHGICRYTMPDGEVYALPFTVLEYVNGPPLSLVLAQADGKGLGVERVRRLFRQVARALSNIHTAQIVHRDLKPSNLLISSDGGHETIKITDFGLVKRFDVDSKGTMALAGASIGYAPPEQFEMGNRRVSSRTDLFSFASVLYEALAGQPAFPTTNATSPFQVLSLVLSGPRPRLANALSFVAPELQEHPELIVALDHEIERALRPDPADRHESVDEFWSIIEPLLHQATERAASGTSRLATHGVPVPRKPSESQLMRAVVPGSGGDSTAESPAPLPAGGPGKTPPPSPVSAAVMAAHGAPAVGSATMGVPATAGPFPAGPAHGGPGVIVPRAVPTPPPGSVVLPAGPGGLPLPPPGSVFPQFASHPSQAPPIRTPIPGSMAAVSAHQPLRAQASSLPPASPGSIMPGAPSSHFQGSPGSALPASSGPGGSGFPFQGVPGSSAPLTPPPRSPLGSVAIPSSTPMILQIVCAATLPDRAWSVALGRDGRAAYAVGRWGVRKLEGGQWVAVALPAGVEPSMLRGVLTTPTGEPIAYGEQGLLLGQGPGGLIPWAPPDPEVTWLSGVLLTTPSEILLVGESAPSGASVIGLLRPGQPLVRRLVEGTGRLLGVTRLAAGVILACGEGGELVFVGSGAADPIEWGRTGHLAAAVAAADGGAHVVGSGGHALLVSAAGEARLEPVQTTRDLFCVALAPDGVPWAGGSDGRLVRRTPSGWIRIPLPPPAQGCIRALEIGPMKLFALLDDGVLVEGSLA